MKSILDKTLRKFFAILKNLLMSNKTLSNAIMDVYNTGEFTDLFEHEKMLADDIRVHTYKRGIQKHIKSDDIVVDLGTGSGILTMFAAQNNPRKIYAIDHSDFIEVAKVLADANGMNHIQFEKVNSRTFNPDEKVDVILHEQIGDDLFDENMIENILDLKRRILKPGGRILPGKFELYLEPVSLKPDYQVPFVSDNEHFGIDFSSIKEHPLLEKYKTRHYKYRYIEPHAVDFIMCEQVPVFSMDLNEDISEINLTIPVQNKKVIQSGVIDGICLYFKAIFDDEISFDTSPLNGKTSWGNRMFRTDRRTFQAGDTIGFDVQMGSPLIADTWTLNLQQPVEVN